MNDEIKIFSTTPEAMLFRDFQKYHEVFALMIKMGVFDVQYGKVILNFQQGELQNLTKEEIVWKKT